MIRKFSSVANYIIRALYDWATDNSLRICVHVDATLEGVCVPKEYVSNGKVTLEISPAAVKNLVISNNLIHFDTKFIGRILNVKLPIAAVLGIYFNDLDRFFDIHLLEIAIFGNLDKIATMNAAPTLPTAKKVIQLKEIASSETQTGTSNDTVDHSTSDATAPTSNYDKKNTKSQKKKDCKEKSGIGVFTVINLGDTK